MIVAGIVIAVLGKRTARTCHQKGSVARPEPRLRTAGACVALLTLWAVGADLVEAAAIQIPASPTSLTSTTKRMISYRNQNHSWQTSDGAIHLMVNTGSAGGALTLYSSFDNGATYVPEFTLPNTDGTSTSDGILGNAIANSNLLQLVYGTQTSSGEILYVAALYNAATQSWAVGTPQLIYGAKGQYASAPAVNVDSTGSLWCSYTVEVVSSEMYNLQMSYQSAGTSTWVRSGLAFGGSDTSGQHAGRPVPLANGIGMVYQDGASMYWAYRLSSWPDTTPWVSTLLYTGLPPAGSDPYDSHFNVAADANGNLFLIFAGSSGALEYLMYSNATGAWGPLQALGAASYDVTYMQVVIAGGNVIFIVNDKTSLVVFQSNNDGASFTLTQALLHTVGTGLDYNNPRVEAPTYCTSPIPPWQQFFSSTTQYLMFFAVPVLPLTGSK